MGKGKILDSTQFCGMLIYHPAERGPVPAEITVAPLLCHMVSRKRRSCSPAPERAPRRPPIPSSIRRVPSRIEPVPAAGRPGGLRLGPGRLQPGPVLRRLGRPALAAGVRRRARQAPPPARGCGGGGGGRGGRPAGAPAGAAAGAHVRRGRGGAAVARLRAAAVPLRHLRGPSPSRNIIVLAL